MLSNLEQNKYRRHGRQQAWNFYITVTGTFCVFT